MSDDTAPITELLNRAGRGDGAAAEQVFARVYDRLRGLATAQRARLRPGETLDTTALVHEAYLRLVDRRAISWSGRNHFYCTAARTMRDLLVEEARRKGSLKRGGDRQRQTLTSVLAFVDASSDDVIALDQALRRLEKAHADKIQIVLLRYFTGLTIPEIADVLRLSHSTVERRWRFCRSWLARELDAPDASP